MLVLFTKFVENFPKKEKKISFQETHRTPFNEVENFQGIAISSPAKTNYLVEE